MMTSQRRTLHAGHRKLLSRGCPAGAYCSRLDSGLHCSPDLVHLGFGVNIAISILLGMDQLVVDGYLQPTCGSGSTFTRHLYLLPELILKFRLDLTELGGVSSSSTINDVHFHFPAHCELG